MRISVPGLPGVYYDTNAESTAMSATLTLAGRRAPKPHGYAAQLLPILWSLDVDLQEVPSDHPFQYLHPEGARSLEELPRNETLRFVARDVDTMLRFAGEVNEQTETALSKLVGSESTTEGVVIEIEDGSIDESVIADESESLESDDEPGFGFDSDDESGYEADDNNESGFGVGSDDDFDELR